MSSADSRSDGSQSTRKGASVCLEISLTSLGLPERPLGVIEGKELAELSETVRKYTGIVHIQLKDCLHLHHKMNSSLAKKSQPVKLQPYVKFYAGAKQDFEKYFGKGGNLNAGILANPISEIQEIFLKRQSNVISAGQDVVWNEIDGKFVFDTEVPAVDLCVLAQVCHEDLMLGQTFIEVKTTVFDVKMNRFTLTDNRMIRVLSNEDNKIIPYNGDPLGKDYWELKPFEDLVRFEIPLTTLFLSFTPKTYTQPSIKVIVKRAEGLPKMDMLTGKADPFVIVSLDQEDEKSVITNIKRFETDVVYRSLEPIWTGNNIFNLTLLSVNPKDLEKQTLQLTVMDYERMSAPREMGTWKASVADLYKKWQTKADSAGNQQETFEEEQLYLTNSAGKGAGILRCVIAFAGNFGGMSAK